ncbi:MAG: hypothetical protein FWF76_02795 [Oscillospiraceae bacterium]|nr:hypothetical protein [Oscillospiraceae bacterium]
MEERNSLVVYRLPNSELTAEVAKGESKRTENNRVMNGLTKDDANRKCSFLLADFAVQGKYWEQYNALPQPAVAFAEVRGGNTEYKYIGQKSYVKTDRDTATKLAERLNVEGIKHSYVLRSGKDEGTVTVNIADYMLCEQYAQNINPAYVPKHMPKLSFNEVLGRFGNLKQPSKGQFTANCPCCADSKNHLYIKHDVLKNTVLLDCKHGCSAFEIMSAIGLKESDLFLNETLIFNSAPRSSTPQLPQSAQPESKPQNSIEKKSATKPKREFIARREHYYTDENGEKWGRKDIVTYPPDENHDKSYKECYWRRFRDGKYVMGLKGDKAPLYNLPAVISTDKVYITEGEKDADTLAALGLVATSSPNGAGADWQKSYNEYFRNKDVVIISDNDKAGIAHSTEISDNLRNVARSLKIVSALEIAKSANATLKDGGDISDVYEAVGALQTSSALLRAVSDVSDIAIENVPQSQTKSEIRDSATSSSLDVARSEFDEPPLPAEPHSLENNVPFVAHEITQNDVNALREIEPRKSVMNFTDDEATATAPFQKQFDTELSDKSPYERRLNDWREAETTSVPVIEVEDRGKTVDDLKVDVKDENKIPRGYVDNTDTGYTFFIGSKGIKETKSKILTKSRRNKDCGALINAMYNIPALVKNGVLLDTKTLEPGANKSRDGIFMHNLYTPFNHNGELYIAKLYVQEILSLDGQRNDKNLYNVSDIKIVPFNAHDFENEVAPQPFVHSGTNISIAQLFEYVKAFDKNFYTNFSSPGRKERIAEVEAEKLNKSERRGDSLAPQSLDEIEPEAEIITMPILPKESPIEKVPQMALSESAREALPTPQDGSALYFRITDDNLGHGGAKAKFKNNITAIETLKLIEAEKRNATPEEQLVMSNYVGWGGISKAV